MSRWQRILGFASFVFIGSMVASALLSQEARSRQALDRMHDRAVTNWPTPLYWSPGGAAQNARVDQKSTNAVPTAPLPFVGLTPCRIVDTRNASFPAGYGPPALSAGVPRSFTLTGQCGIAPEAQAVSLNITVVSPSGVGYVLLYPQGSSQPVVSTLNFTAGETLANAAIVPLGVGGGITVAAALSDTELLIDTNGMFLNDLSTSAGQFSFTSNIDGANNGAGVVVGHNTNSGGANSWGGQFSTDSCNAGSAGAFGVATSTSSCGDTFGLWGRSFGTTDGSAGIFGEDLGGSGAIFGVAGSSWSASNGAAGTVGSAVAASNNNTFGMKGSTFSSNLDAAGVKGVGGYGDPLGDDLDCGPCYSAGVRGVNNFSGTSQAFGVLGVSRSRGVGGAVLNTSGTGTAAYGFLGYNSGANFYGVFANGDFGGTGAKYFVEPHPHDPSKAIRYVALEGPEAGTYFRGTARTQGGRAIIEVPESFRLVTEEDALTVQLTPIGDLATLAVVSQDLNRIVVISSKDVRFAYHVNGIRHGYRDFDPVTTSSEFAPGKPNAEIPAMLTDAEKRSLISNGTYNEDGTVNLETARILGWDRYWRRPAEEAKATSP